MAMAKKIEVFNKTTWYVYCRDARTNEVVREMLSGLHSEEKSRTALCADGKRRELCQVPNYEFLARLQRSKYSANLDFEPYRSQGDLPPDIFPFLSRRKTTVEKLFLKSLLKKAG